jgi:hypothetical protein
MIRFDLRLLFAFGRLMLARPRRRLLAQLAKEEEIAQSRAQLEARAATLRKRAEVNVESSFVRYCLSMSCE